ncbi:MAG: hypothetical protein V7645_129, partial [Actinomycetota bacterium]
VQQRDHSDGGGLHAFERIFEGGSLDRDEKEVDRLEQFGSSVRKHGLDALAMSQGQSPGRDQVGRVRPGDADDPDSSTHESDSEDAADGPWAEDRNGHVFAGSVIRLMYFHSV